MTSRIRSNDGSGANWMIDEIGSNLLRKLRGFSRRNVFRMKQVNHGLVLVANQKCRRMLIFISVALIELRVPNRLGDGELALQCLVVYGAVSQNALALV